jgi:hypothetical protein
LLCGAECAEQAAAVRRQDAPHICRFFHLAFDMPAFTAITPPFHFIAFRFRRHFIFAYADAIYCIHFSHFAATTDDFRQPPHTPPLPPPSQLSPAADAGHMPLKLHADSFSCRHYGELTLFAG